MKCIFFGTPEFAASILEKLHEAKIQIVAIVTRPDTPQGRSLMLSPPAVKRAASSLFKDVPLLQPSKSSSPEFIEILKSFGADLFIVVAYGEIVSQTLLDIPPKGCINVHASLLPAYRGAAPMQRCLMNGDRKTGVAIMRMVRKMDAGAILKMEEVDVPEDMNIGELQQKLSTLGAKALLDVLDVLKTTSFAGTAQDETKVSFAPKITPQDGHISWNLSARTIHNLVRALTPSPGAVCDLLIKGSKKRLKINRSKVFSEDESSEKPPSTFFQNSKDTLFVVCGRGILQILEVQLEGKKSMPVQEFLRGTRFSDILSI
jgi:methionyl-tRNA formyltransferase